MLGLQASRVKNHPDYFQFPALAKHTIEMSCFWRLRTEQSTPPLTKPDVYSLRPQSNCPISVKSDHGQSDYCQPPPSVLHSIDC